MFDKGVKTHTQPTSQKTQGADSLQPLCVSHSCLGQLGLTAKGYGLDVLFGNTTWLANNHPVMLILFHTQHNAINTTLSNTRWQVIRGSGSQKYG